MNRNTTLVWVSFLSFVFALTTYAQTGAQERVSPPVGGGEVAEARQAAPPDSPNPDDYDVIDSAKWRTVKLSIDLSHGGRCDITLARPLPWLDLVGAKSGATINLQMPEMGIAGTAKVVAIEPCPEFSPPKPGSRPVIGKFVTTNAKVIELSIEGLDEHIGTTASHPFWSLDRKGWVAAGDLKPGEKLRTQDGSATVKSVVPRPGTETVYNIEVHKDHTFFVSEAKLWVHNTCIFRSKREAIRSVIPNANIKTTRHVPGGTWDPRLTQEGFTDVHYVTTTQGQQVTVFSNPRTGDWADPHLSSGSR
jgi:hypothetical protein